MHIKPFAMAVVSVSIICKPLLTTRHDITYIIWIHEVLQVMRDSALFGEKKIIDISQAKPGRHPFPPTKLVFSYQISFYAPLHRADLWLLCLLGFLWCFCWGLWKPFAPAHRIPKQVTTSVTTEASSPYKAFWDEKDKAKENQEKERKRDRKWKRVDVKYLALFRALRRLLYSE